MKYLKYKTVAAVILLCLLIYIEMEIRVTCVCLYIRQLTVMLLPFLEKIYFREFQHVLFGNVFLEGLLSLL